jgi:titin
MTFSPWRRWKARLLTSPRLVVPPGRVRPQVEILEDRLVLNTYTVTNTADVGTGSLRQAILMANADTTRDTIVFNILGAGVHSIALATALPVIQNAVILDATTQPGYSGSPLIELNGAAAASAAIGLWVTAGNSVIRGFVINRFGDRGILLQTGGGNVVTGNYVGTDVTGQVALPNGSGINVVTSNNNVIGGTTPAARNLVSGNRGAGISVYTGASNNLVEGNYVGTDVSGTFSVGNGYGVGVYGVNTTANTIGGTAAGAGNLISGNGSGSTGDGVSIFASATGTLVQANLIGTDISGQHLLGNAGSGVGISSAGNRVGGGGGVGRNILSGNGGYGVALLTGATNNVISGNLIGTDNFARNALGNRTAGVGITGGASSNVIGGAVPGAGNIISGNTTYGVVLFNAGTTGNQVQGNFIGVDATGQAALGNTGYGVGIANGASGNTIGAAGSGALNVISANTLGGVVVFGSGTNNDVVQGNRIGTDNTGTLALGNGGSGVAVVQGAANTLIGGAGAGNQVAGNHGDGIQVAGPSTTGTVIQGNRIGTDPTGASAIPNQFHGVDVLVSAVNTVIGGSAPGTGNLISGNAGAGVLIDQGVQITLVQGNYVGTSADGSAAVPNGQGGVTVAQGSGSTLIDSNVISGNRFYGVFLTQTGYDTVQFNRIGTDPTGTYAVPNEQGGIILTTAANITIAANVVSGNTTDGITLNPGQAVIIQGNLIGTDISGTSPLGNGGNGIWVVGEGPVNVQIGAEDPQSANVIAFDGNDGVLVQDAQGVAILGNSIHDDANLGIELVGAGNNGQPAPQLTAVTSDGSSTTIEGTLTAAPDSSFTIEFFSDGNVDSPQGARFLGSMTVTTDDDGNASFSVTLNVGLDSGQAVTATATDGDNNTSQFSEAALVNAGEAAPPDRDRFFVGISRKVLLG